MFRPRDPKRGVSAATTQPAARRTLVGMDVPLDGAQQPACPECGIVMRDIPGAWQCPHCGHLQLHDDIELPPEFDGPSIHGG